MKDVREYHDKLNSFFHLTLALPLVPMGFLYLEISHRGWTPMFDHDPWVTYSCLASAVLTLIWNYTNYRKHVLAVRNVEGTTEKFLTMFPVYRNLYLVNLAVALILTIGYYFTGSGPLIGSYVLQLFFLSFLRPYADRYINDLQLTADEAKRVRKRELSFQAVR